LEPVKEVVYSLKWMNRPEGLLRKAEDEEEKREGEEEGGWKRTGKAP
jgi:hypothetical protein